MARPEKVQAVQEIGERFKGSTAALLTEYRGLTVSEIAELRTALRQANADYKVLKNTLARIAAKEVGLEELSEMLQGPTAVAFVHGDAVEAARALDDAAKKFPVLVIKGGVLDGRIVTAEQAQQLAKLEPREVQLSKIVMMINTPVQQTANVLSALLRDFGSMLAQLVTQKESEAPAAETPEPTPATDASQGRPEGDEPEPTPDQAEVEPSDSPEASAQASVEETLGPETIENPEVGAGPEAEAPSETDPDQAEVTDGGDPSQGTGDAGDDQSGPAEK